MSKKFNKIGVKDEALRSYLARTINDIADKIQKLSVDEQIEFITGHGKERNDVFKELISKKLKIGFKCIGICEKTVVTGHISSIKESYITIKNKQNEEFNVQYSSINWIEKKITHCKKCHHSLNTTKSVIRKYSCEKNHKSCFIEGHYNTKADFVIENNRGPSRNFGELIHQSDCCAYCLNEL